MELIRSLAPDFAIIDLHMPKLHGLEVIRKVREANSPSKLVVLSISRDEKMVIEALRAGADGYLLKDGPARHLLDAISYSIQDGGNIYFLLAAPGLSAGSPFRRSAD